MKRAHLALVAPLLATALIAAGCGTSKKSSSTTSGAASASSTPQTSNCTGECATAWPPVTTGAAATVSGAAMSEHLGTITRADGTKQVTYNGHPVYFFAKDKDDGDANGQGLKAFGASWYVLAPRGNKVDLS
jgi:predicted lipoprotein with Yx(FWY)xxD motif